MFEGVLDTPPNSNDEKVAPNYQQKKTFLLLCLILLGFIMHRVFLWVVHPYEKNGQVTSPEIKIHEMVTFDSFMHSAVRMKFLD